jgi:hypothetical protein
MGLARLAPWLWGGTHRLVDYHVDSYGGATVDRDHTI